MLALQSVEAVPERCLDCHVNQRRIAIPLRFVNQLVEYDRYPMPLARAHVGGLGILEGKIVVSLSLSGNPTLAPQKMKAVQFRGLPGSVSWALEVDATFSFIDVTRQTGPFSPRGDPWLVRATNTEGNPLAWLDVERFYTLLLAPAFRR